MGFGNRWEGAGDAIMRTARPSDDTNNHTNTIFGGESNKGPPPGPGPRNISRPSVGPVHNLQSGRPTPASQQTPRRSAPHKNRREPRKGRRNNCMHGQEIKIRGAEPPAECRSDTPASADTPPGPCRHMAG